VPNTDRFLAYLAAYAQKDLVAIRAMFSEDVHLRDWNLSVHGRDAALDETAKNFAAAETIEIEALAVYAKEGAVARVLPHPSLKRSANGRPSGLVRRYTVHFRQPGPGVLRLAPLQTHFEGDARCFS
jgi:ketosteroid isomerase-like protein